MTRSSTRGWIWWTGIGALAAVLFPGSARAGGFQLNEMGPKFLGTALAGTAAEADDATTGFFNAAGLTRIKNGSVVGAANLVHLPIQVTAESATTFGKPVTNEGGGMTTAGGNNKFVPAFHFAQRLTDDMVGYLGVTAPFGLETDYPDNSVARYVATLSQLTTINVNPGFGYALHRWVPGLSIGFGFNAQYARARLNQNLANPFNPSAGDASVQIAGEDWAFGWNGGLLYEFTEKMRVGVAYRSQVSHNLSGRVEIYQPDGSSARTGANAGATFPDSVVFSGYWEFAPGYAVLGDFLYTHWQRFQFLGIHFDSLLPYFRQDFDFRDTYRGSIGFEAKPIQDWTFRIGSGFDGSPVYDANRTLRLPDGNRILLGFGVGYDLGEGVKIDLGYLHLFVQKGKINQTSTGIDQSTFKGSTAGQGSDVIGLQATYNWDSFPPKIPFF